MSALVGKGFEVSGGKVYVNGVRIPCVVEFSSRPTQLGHIEVELRLIVPFVRHEFKAGGRVTPSGKNACELCGEAWPCTASQA